MARSVLVLLRKTITTYNFPGRESGPLVSPFGSAQSCRQNYETKHTDLLWEQVISE